MSNASLDRRLLVTEIYSLAHTGKIRSPQNLAHLLSYPIRLCFSHGGRSDFDPMRALKLELKFEAHFLENDSCQVELHENGIVIGRSTVASNGIFAISAHLPEHKARVESIEIKLHFSKELKEGDEIKFLRGQLERADSIGEDRLSIVDIGRQAAERIFRRVGCLERFGNLQQVVKVVSRAVEKEEPFSLVRLGDGEGRLLGYPNLLWEHETLRDTINYMFGPAALQQLKESYGPYALKSAIDHISGMIKDAMSDADIVGLPSPSCYDLSPNDRNIASLLGFSAVSTFALARLRPAQTICDTFIFRAIQVEDLFKTMMANVRRLTVISHTDYSAEISKYLAIPLVDTIIIPGHYTFMPSSLVHYPLLFGEIVKKIEVRHPGHVYLIAAGYLGKHYCDVVKQRGGVALDVGSIFDGWVGKGRMEAIEDQRLRLFSHREETR